MSGPVALLLAAIAIAAGAACTYGQPAGSAAPQGAASPTLLPVTSTVAGVRGRLLYPSLNGWSTVEPGSGTTKQVAAIAPSTYPREPAVSPDGSLIAYSLYLPQGAGVADLRVMQADGSSDRLLLEHADPWRMLGEPAWSPDGRTLYFTARNAAGATRLEKVNSDGTGRIALVDDAASPSVAADGKSIAYVLSDPKSYEQSLWVAGPDGSNPRQLAGDPHFLAVGWPRFGPAGQIAFSAVENTRAEAAPRLPWEPETAYAHGIPWDLWIVQSDGTGLHRVTDLGEDSPIPVWSPDAKWIALSAELGLYLVPLNGDPAVRISDDLSLGGLTWLEP